MTTGLKENPQRLEPGPRPLFLYGPLRALPLLAWAITGDSAKVDAVKPLVQPARVRGYARFSLHGRDYPAVVKVKLEREHGAGDSDASSGSASAIDGLLFRPQHRAQRTKLDDFEGETYRAVPVAVEVLGSGGGLDTVVDADIYVWDGAGDDVSAEAWDFATFVRERLDDWLELFGGMELVGDEDSDDPDSSEAQAQA